MERFGEKCTVSFRFRNIQFLSQCKEQSSELCLSKLELDSRKVHNTKRLAGCIIYYFYFSLFQGLVAKLGEIRVQSTGSALKCTPFRIYSACSFLSSFPNRQIKLAPKLNESACDSWGRPRAGTQAGGGRFGGGADANKIDQGAFTLILILSPSLPPSAAAPSRLKFVIVAAPFFNSLRTELHRHSNDPSESFPRRNHRCNP